jgi:fluoroacetyl-CoA thioesterase
VAIEIGSQSTVTRTVATSDLASALSNDPEHQFPEVFATSRMIALMELAAAQVLRPLLEEGELSVGVTVDVTHSAPTGVGETVSATARYVERDGKLYIFEVTAADAAGEIGRGTHRRAIISTSRLLQGAERRRR